MIHIWYKFVVMFFVILQVLGSDLKHLPISPTYSSRQATTLVSFCGNTYIFKFEAYKQCVRLENLLYWNIKLVFLRLLNLFLTIWIINFLVYLTTTFEQQYVFVKRFGLNRTFKFWWIVYTLIKSVESSWK